MAFVADSLDGAKPHTQVTGIVSMMLIHIYGETHRERRLPGDVEALKVN
jgi:hypothetical protein